MKYLASFLALVAAALAQNNAINIPAGGLQITAGQPFTITWSDPSSSTVTIKLQQGSGVTPTSGITLLTGVEASAKTATFTILADEVNSSQYNIEIIDDSDPSDYNFTPGFVVAGATCVGTCDGSASSSASGSATSAAASSTAAASSSASASSASASSSSASSSISSASSASASASSTTASSAAAPTATTAPSNAAAGGVKAQAGLVIAFVAAVVAF